MITEYPSEEQAKPRAVPLALLGASQMLVKYAAACRVYPKGKVGPALNPGRRGAR